MKNTVQFRNLPTARPTDDLSKSKSATIFNPSLVATTRWVAGPFLLLLWLAALPLLAQGLTGVTVAGGNGGGSGANQLNGPTDLSVDEAENIFVVELFNYRVQKFPSGSTSLTDGTTVAGGNGFPFPPSPTKFLSVGEFVDSDGNLFVTDVSPFSHRVLRFPPGSTSSTSGTVVAGGNGSGADPNQLDNPGGVFVDASGNLFVSDNANHRIQKFVYDTPSDTYATDGVTVAGGNGVGSGTAQLDNPGGVFVDADGNLFVADKDNHRIQKFPAGSTSSTAGITVAGGNGEGSAANQLDEPYNLFIDAAGTLFVADTGNDRVQKFPAGSTSATAGITVAGGQGAGDAADQLRGPSAVVVDGAGQVFVVDTDNNRVQKFLPILVTAQPAASVSACLGTDASYSVVASSQAASLSYQWYKGNTVLLSQTTSTLILNNLQPDDAGTYSVLISNDVSTLRSSSLELTVNPLPTVDAGPDQSVILGFGGANSNCTDLTATASGGTSPYIYAWNNGAGSTATVNVCPEETTTYEVTVTDGNGCQATDKVTVEVQDVRCGPGNKYVTICYYGVTQCVREKIAKRYLKIGATLGSCGSGNARLGIPEGDERPLQLTLKAYPNPVRDAVTVEILSTTAGPGTFEVLDMQGRARQTRKQDLQEGLNEVEFRLGSLPTGIYLIRAQDALNRQGTVKISKQ